MGKKCVTPGCGKALSPNNVRGFCRRCASLNHYGFIANARDRHGPEHMDYVESDPFEILRISEGVKL